MRDIHSDREILSAAVVDGINRYLRDVLQPRGIIAQEYWNDSDDHFHKMKYKIAEEVAASWQHSQLNDDVWRRPYRCAGD